MEKNFNWDAEVFFGRLTAKNKLAQAHGFRFCRVSGLRGFEEALGAMQNTAAFVCIQEQDDGFISLENTPHTRRVKTVFLAMRHAIDHQEMRNACFDIMREIFRQFMTKLILERTKLANNHIYLDQRITFNEIEPYFASGCACAYFQVAVDTFTDLRLREDEWIADGEIYTEQFNKVYA